MTPNRPGQQRSQPCSQPRRGRAASIEEPCTPLHSAGAGGGGGGAGAEARGILVDGPTPPLAQRDSDDPPCSLISAAPPPPCISRIAAGRVSGPAARRRAATEREEGGGRAGLGAQRGVGDLGSTKAPVVPGSATDAVENLILVRILLLSVSASEATASRQLP